MSNPSASESSTSKPATEYGPYFKPKDFACSHCGKIFATQRFVDALNQLRMRVGYAILHTSTYRCKDHPIEAAKHARGQSAPGPHERGQAGDIYVMNNQVPLRTFLKIIQTMPIFKGVGYAPWQNFVHVDVDRPIPAKWGYDKNGAQIPWNPKWDE